MNPLKTAVLVLVAGYAAVASAEIYTSGTIDVGSPVPQSNGQYLLSDSYAFAGLNSDITGISVHVDVAGGHIGDLYGYLLLEDNSDNAVAEAVLLNRPGRDSSNNNGYSDSGLDLDFAIVGSDIHQYQTSAYGLNGDGQLIGTYGADGRNDWPGYGMTSDPRTALLNSFLGANPNGTWTIALYDAGNSNSSATLVNWSLQITAVPEPSSPILVLGGLLLSCIFVVRGGGARRDVESKD